MVNYLAQSLFTMAVFDSVLCVIGLPTISYNLFVMGVFSIVIADLFRINREIEAFIVSMIVLMILILIVWLLNNPSPATPGIIAVGIVSILLTEGLFLREGQARKSDNNVRFTDKPLGNLMVSLPSATMLLVLITFASQ